MKLKPDPNILHELRKIGEDVSSSYTGAFTVLDKKNNKERIAQSAHSIRETLNLIARKTHIVDEVNDDVLKTKLIVKFDPQGALPISFQDSYKNLVELHAWFTNVSHHGSFPNDSEYSNKINQLQASLRVYSKTIFSESGRNRLATKKRFANNRRYYEIKKPYHKLRLLKIFF